MFGLKEKKPLLVENNIREEIVGLLNDLLAEDKNQIVEISQKSKDKINLISQKIVGEPSIKEDSSFYAFLNGIKENLGIFSSNSELIQQISTILRKIDSELK